MKQYINLVKEVLTFGEERTDRTGVGTISLFGYQNRYDLREGFPILTTKKVHFESVVKELLWFLSGSTNIQDLGCGIWDAWADDIGNLQKIYGFQWRHWGGIQSLPPVTTASSDLRAINYGGIDQITETINQIKTNPFSRRIIVNSWNVSDLNDMALPPCHVLCQFYCGNHDFLDLQLYQRSADLALGVPFNVASYALLLSMVAMVTGKKPRYFIHSFGDVHIYKNHVDGLLKQINRKPKPLPQLVLTPRKNIDDFKLDDIKLVGYNHHPYIKFDIAV